MAPQIVHIRQALVALALCAFLMPLAAEAQNSLFVDQAGSNPADGRSALPLNTGKKGLMVRFNFSVNLVPNEGAWPVNLSAAAVMLQVDGNAPVTCTAGTVAPPGSNCVFSAASLLPGGALRYAKIVYGADFPA